MRRVRVKSAGRARRAVALWFALAAFAGCLPGVAAAQSGRRREKPGAPLPAPTEVTQPPPSPPPGTLPAEVKSVVVAAELSHDAAYLRSNFVETTLKAVTERLKEHGLPGVTSAGDMSRQEALETAKGKAGQYVVWLQIKALTKPVPALITRVDYFVFTPQTGQLWHTAKVVPPREGRGPVIMGIPTSGRVDPSDQLKWAGRQIADQIHQRLGQ